MYPFGPRSIHFHPRRCYQRICCDAYKNVGLANGVATLVHSFVALVNGVAALVNVATALVNGVAAFVNGSSAAWRPSNGVAALVNIIAAFTNVVAALVNGVLALISSTTVHNNVVSSNGFAAHVDNTSACKYAVSGNGFAVHINGLAVHINGFTDHAKATIHLPSTDLFQPHPQYPSRVFNTIACKDVAIVNVTAALNNGLTAVVKGVAGTAVHVCGFADLINGGTALVNGVAGLVNGVVAFVHSTAIHANGLVALFDDPLHLQLHPQSPSRVSNVTSISALVRHSIRFIYFISFPFLHPKTAVESLATTLWAFAHRLSYHLTLHIIQQPKLQLLPHRFVYHWFVSMQRQTNLLLQPHLQHPLFKY